MDRWKMIETSPTSIRPNELQQRRDAGESIRMIDVRTPVEHEEVHIDGVQLMPLDKLDPSIVRNSLPAGATCVVICGSGGRATRAAQSLRDAGCGGIVVLEGGMTAWQQAGLPVVHSERKHLPLMRQVQLVIGTMVLAGTLLSQFVDPRFIWLAVFMGAGMVFAGASGWCGLAILLSKMPWNRTTSSGKSCSI
jgi:rhodanese-related sulfurtransferase